jgi:hypothetical protein
MEKIMTKGQFLFGIAIVAFGVEDFFCAHFGLAVRGVPWFPANPFLEYLTGAVLIAAGLSIAANIRTRTTAILLGFLFLVYVLFFELPQVVAQPLDLSVRSVCFEALALSAAAWTLAQTLPRGNSRWESMLDRVTVLGPYLFAISSVVFGSTHFLILRFISSLIPTWIPGGLFWAYLTGAAFVAAGLSIAIRWMDEWAAFLLGVMFLLWVVLLHSPRVVAHPHNTDEWSSAFIALAMCGGSWIVAKNAQQRRAHIKNHSNLER